MRRAWVGPVWLLAGWLVVACASTPTGPGGDGATLDTDAQATSGYDGGFFLRSPDGDAELVIEGLFQSTLAWHEGVRDPSAEAAIKRMRPELSGHVADARFKLEPKFTEHEVELEEAWIGADLWGGDARLMIGRMKAPFGLEEVRSRRHIDFPAFSLVNQFSPAEDHGLFVNGRAAGGLVEYGLAAYNGTGASDTNASKDLAARVMVHPFLDEEASLWRNFQIGVAGTVGKQEASTKGVTLDNEAGGAVVHFADDSFLDGDRTRLGLELAWYRGPWFAQAEYLAVAQDMRAGAAAPTEVGFRGAYVTLSRVLTGENKTYGGVDPDQPFDLKTGHGRGAWVLALRLSQLESDDDLEALGLASPGRFTDELRSASIGLNWIPNGHIIVRHALILSDYGQPVMLDRGLGDDEVSLMIEFQLHF